MRETRLESRHAVRLQGGPLNVAPGQVHVAHPAIGAPNGTTTILFYDIHNLDQNLFPLQGDTGSLSLYERFVLKATSIPNLNTVGVSLATVSPVGIFVQRVVGHHRLLGRRVPLLRAVGRIPLGKFARGKHKIHWQPRVNGHRLRPGRYQFTVRALSRSGKVRDLGKPRLLRVR